MKILVTGGCGFIGSWLAEKLLDRGKEVVVFDNLSTGKKKFIASLMKKENFEFRKVDLVTSKLDLSWFDTVFHLAANPEVRLGAQDTRIHLEQNVLATYNLLEAMRKSEVKEIIFTSTSTVYGEATQIPTPEHYAPLKPISLYGASKLACEALISAYCHTFDMDAVIYRFANVVGPRSTHGVTYDFIQKLYKNPKRLEILGNGKQKKSYCYVDDCVDGILFGWKKRKAQVKIFNIGSEDWIDVRTIADIVCEEMHVAPRYEFTGGRRGWPGDVPRMLLSIDKLKKLGWFPRYTSAEAIRLAARSLIKGNSTC